MQARFLKEIATIIAITCCWAIPQAGADAPSLNIGVILPLTGPSAFIGVTGKAAVDLAIAQLPPEDKKRVKVIYEDDGLVANRSIAAGHKLLDIDRVDALLTWSSSTGLSLASVTERKQIPHLSIASDPAVAVGRTYTFTYWALPHDEADTLYEYLVSSGKKRVAILAVAHNGLLATRDAFIDEAKRDGRVQIVAHEEVAPDVQDFRGVLERIKSKGDIDAFIPIFFPGQLSIAVRQARALGITAPLVGFETFEDKDEILAAQGLFSGVVFATGADPSQDFIDAFQKANPGATMYTASNCYDSIRLLIEASRIGKDGNTVSTFLRSLKNYKAVSGIISATGDNRFSLPTTLKTIDKNGRVVRFK
jgi:branched-chain amino acid transport system substrate-binding protein